MESSAIPQKCNLYRLFCRDRQENPMPPERAHQLRAVLQQLLLKNLSYPSSQGGTS